MNTWIYIQTASILWWSVLLIIVLLYFCLLFTVPQCCWILYTDWSECVDSYVCLCTKTESWTWYLILYFKWCLLNPPGKKNNNNVISENIKKVLWSIHNWRSLLISTLDEWVVLVSVFKYCIWPCWLRLPTALFLISMLSSMITLITQTRWMIKKK